MDSSFSVERDRNVPSRTKAVRSLVRVDEAGAEFISYRDGSRHRFTPEGVVETGLELGADLIMPLDECTSPLYSREETRAALERTHRWALRSLAAFQERANEGQALFGIIQGGDFEDLRRESARFMAGQDFHGLAIGGYLGQSRARMAQVLRWTIPHLPEANPGTSWASAGWRTSSRRSTRGSISWIAPPPPGWP